MKPIVIEIVDPHAEMANPKPEHLRAIIEPHNPITTCRIEWQYEPITPNGWHDDTAGFSFCRPAEIYDFETGCRLALASALRKVGKDRVRELFWKAYLEKFPVSSRTDPAKLSRKRLVKELTSTFERDFTRAIYSSVFRIPMA